MKIIKIIALVLIVLLTLAYFLMPKDKGEENQEIIIEEVPATLTSLSPDVSLLESEQGESWNVISDKTDIFNGSRIKTSVEGRAIISKDADIITSIDSNSVVTYSNPDSEGSKFYLESGKVWSHVNRKLEQDEVYEVYTPTMVAAVRGTSFGVKVDENDDQILVTEGIVTVSQTDPETGEPIDGTETEVNENQKVSVKDGNLSVNEITEDDKDDWFNSENPDYRSPDSNSEGNEDTQVTPPTTDTKEQPQQEEVIQEEVKQEPEPETEPTTTKETSTTTVTVTSVSPSIIEYQSDITLEIRGSGFKQFEFMGLNEQIVDIEIVNDSLIYVHPSELAKLTPGTYSVSTRVGIIPYTFYDVFEVVRSSQ